MGPYPYTHGPWPSRTGSTGSRRYSDGESFTSQSPIQSPKRPRGGYNWKTFDAYESHRDVMRYYHPVRPSVVRARWYSDGTRYYRLGAQGQGQGQGHSDQQAGSLGHGHGNGQGTKTALRQSV